MRGIVILAAALRLPALDSRPMHADESVHAAKFGRLLETGFYQYDPKEYHGPTLYYLALVPAHLRGISRYADLDEAVLRSVPAVSGVLLVLAHLLLIPVIGYRASALAALLTAVSPAMVYYSRYFIQETLLVTFSFGALASVCRYLRTPRLGWAVAAGVSAGLMFATKETWVIAVAAMAAALVPASIVAQRQAGRGVVPWRRVGTHVAVAALAGGAVSALLFSSFLSHPRGILDSVAAYSTYFDRAGGGATSWHLHPWDHYLGLLAYSSAPGAPVWTEAAILALAAGGLLVALAGVRGRAPHGVLEAGRPALVFLAGYAVLMTAIYAAIPYKTPWSALGFLHGLVLMAGVAAARWVGPLPLSGRTVPRRHVWVSVLLGGAVFHLGWLAWSASVPFASDPRNPLVYAHTGIGVFEIAGRVETLSRAHPDGAAMPVEVISGQNLWPLPWYLRRFSAVRWETAPVNDGVHAPVILTTPDMEEAVVRKLYEWRRPGERELYVPVFDHPVELRPMVEVRGYAAKSLWDAAQGR